MSLFMDYINSVAVVGDLIVNINDQRYKIEGELKLTEIIDEVITPNKMQLGINSNWVSNWDSPKYFINLARNLSFWKGNKPLVQRYGKIISCDPNTQYKANVIDKNAGINVKAAIYHITWAGEGELSINGSDSPVCFHDGETFINVEFKGTRLDSLTIIHEDDIAQYEAGNEWQSDYLNFYQTLNTTVIRAMNWQKSSEDYTHDWIDRVTPDDISFSLGVPFEVIIDFANRMNQNLWVCYPARASEEYIAQASQLIAKTLNTSLYVELGNEIWNTAYPWADGTAWVRNEGNIKLTATADKISESFKLKNHGLETGEDITCYTILDNALNNLQTNWTLRSGITAQVDVISNDFFRVRYNNKIQEIVNGQTELLFSRNKLITADLDRHYTWKSELIWESLEPLIFRDKLNFILSSQYNNPWITEQRYNALSDKTKLDAIAIAPYYGIKPEPGLSYDQYALRELASFPEKIGQHFIDDVPVICYEGGPHLHDELPEELDDWLYGYWRSDDCAKVISLYKQWLEENGIDLFCYYKDASTTRFGLCTEINEANEDGRYRGFIGN